MIHYPKVMTEDETLDAALAGRSLARFGDGELRLAIGNGCSSQHPDKRLMEEYREILAGRTRALPCIPNILGPTPRREGWSPYLQEKYVRCYNDKITYGSAFITRPDSMPHIDRPDYWDKVRRLWADKHVVLVRGDEKSLTPSRMPEAASIREVIGPRTNAYECIDKLESKIGKPEGPVILCLGACATALAHRLAGKGLWALDLGHVGMFMKHAGAYVVPLEHLASKRYREVLKAQHGRKGFGGEGHTHLDEVLKFRDFLVAKSILDYGCGKGTLAECLAVKQIRVMEYDPGVEGKGGYPKPAELVVCTDVLEHVEPELLDNVLRHIWLLAGKGAYLVISLGASKHTLADGRNAHLVQEPAHWWIGKLEKAGYKIQRTDQRKALHVWAIK